jgi:hypothetical protein
MIDGVNLMPCVVSRLGCAGHLSYAHADGITFALPLISGTTTAKEVSMACAAWRKALCELATYPEPASTKAGGLARNLLLRPCMIACFLYLAESWLGR